MRPTMMMVCSTTHIPFWERTAINVLIASSPQQASGRVIIQHELLVIEGTAYGFLLGTEVVADQETRPDDISEALWALLETAYKATASWIMFDCDEPADPDFPVFDDAQNEDLAENTPSVAVPS